MLIEGIRHHIAALLWGSCLLLAGSAYADAIAVVAPKGLAEPAALSLQDLRALYLGNSRSFGGSSLTPSDHDASTRIYASFTQAVIGRSRRALENYWLEEILSGGKEPPRQIDGDPAVARHVATNPGTIGYVSWAWLESQKGLGVRIIKIRHKGRTLAPGDPGYPLRID